MWIGVADIDSEKPSENCFFTNPDSSREPDYENWAESFPKCNPAAHSCAYMEISSTDRNWKTETCGSAEAFACEIDVGTQIHPVPKPPNERHCSGMGYTINFVIQLYEIYKNHWQKGPRNYLVRVSQSDHN